MVLKMPFLILSNVNSHFTDKKLTWRSFITAEALFTIKQVELINKKKFAKVALDENVEVFVVHMTSISLNKPKMSIYPAKKA